MRVAGEDALRLYIFAVVPRLEATHFWASRHPEGHPQDVLMEQTYVRISDFFFTRNGWMSFFFFNRMLKDTVTIEVLLYARTGFGKMNATIILIIQVWILYSHTMQVRI